MKRVTSLWMVQMPCAFYHISMESLRISSRNIISYWTFFVGFIVDVSGNWFVPIGVWVVARCMFLGKLWVALIWINQIIIVMITHRHFILFLACNTYHLKFLLQSINTCTSSWHAIILVFVNEMIMCFGILSMESAVDAP